MPLVSVLVPVFNARDYLNDSLRSIINQSFKDFELILVDDASTDNSATLLQTISDSRMRFIQHEENKGIGEALNSGLKLAQGKYILRMDADDIAYPNRIARQVDFMEKYPQIGVSGTLAEYFDKAPFNIAVNNEYLKPSLLLDCPFVHPTVIVRKEVLDKHGLQFTGYLEDYELWIKLSDLTDFGLLPEILLRYRRSENQFTSQNFEKRRSEANKLRISFAEHWLKRELTSNDKLIISVGIPEDIQPNLEYVDLLCNELLEKATWIHRDSAHKVVKKLFLRNYYRSPKNLKSSLQLVNNDIFSIRERLNLLKKSIFSLL